MTQKHVLSNRRLVARWVGSVLLLLGLGSAGVVYAIGESHSARLAHDQDIVHIDSRDDTLSFEDSKISSRVTEMYFGKVGVLMATWGPSVGGIEKF
jgi:hypothetical protein